MNITFSADAQLIKTASEFAKAHGTTLNKMIRVFLTSLIAENGSEKYVDYFLQMVEQIQVDSKGKQWTRNEIYEL